jgi:regulator of sigma E protease
MNFIITLIILILVLSIIVFIHEFGHFIAAKKQGVHVSEFAIGMGPKIFSFRRKNDETLYSLRLFPLGGFNAIAYDKESSPELRDDQVLESKSYLGRFSVLIMGIIFNFLLAILFLFINGLLYGSPETSPHVGEVVKDSPAYVAGLKSDDLVLKVDGKSVSSWNDILLETHFGEEEKSFTFLVLRGGKEKKIVISPQYKENEDGDMQPSFGFTARQDREKGFFAALKYGFVGTYNETLNVFKVLGKLVTGKIGAENLSGPIGVFSVIDNSKESGLENIIYLTAYLSINIAIINLLPIPVFDGGRILLLLIEKIKGGKINPKIETYLNNIGAILLILLMLYVTLNDIFKLF